MPWWKTQKRTLVNKINGNLSHAQGAANSQGPRKCVLQGATAGKPPGVTPARIAATIAVMGGDLASPAQKAQGYAVTGCTATIGFVVHKIVLMVPGVSGCSVFRMAFSSAGSVVVMR